MSPNGISSGFHEISTFSSSESSDFEFYVKEDIKNGGNLINRQWEAIERTLYQEQGQQITDPELLKECKLWRETFPHFRVKGTKINVQLPDNETYDENEKKVQTIKNHVNLKNLEEKRESIKKKVVGMLVERLIAKYGFIKEEFGNEEADGSGVRITEVLDDASEKSPGNNKSVNKNSEMWSIVSHDKESYFERGKLQNGETVSREDGLSKEQMEEKLYEIFTSWENETKTVGDLHKSYDAKKLPASGLKSSIKLSQGRTKANKFTPSPGSLSSLAKPFEITNKIDKKYEGLIEKIMDRRNNAPDATRHRHDSSSGLGRKSYQESLEKLRREFGPDNYFMEKDKLKINKFNNNWLNRSEMNCCRSEADLLPTKSKSPKSAKPKNACKVVERNQNDFDEKFLKQLKMEMSSGYKRPAKINGVVEDISLRRPKPFVPGAGIKISKSSSSKDLPRKNKQVIKRRQSGLGSDKGDSDLKNPIESKNLNNRRNQNQLLPPIETGIICTELSGRPKIGSRNPIKKY